MNLIKFAANVSNESSFSEKTIDIFLNIGFGIAFVLILLKVKKVIFRRAQEKNEGLHLLFFDRIFTAIIILAGVILTISTFGGIGDLWKTLLGGTAVTSAVIAFAAQDVLKDILGGLMISVHKPFEKGNRIELDDGTAGIVEDMNTRHIVIKKIDSLRVVVPNSKIATMKIINYSYSREDRAIHFNFNVGYDSDMEKVKEIIDAAVKESEYSIPGKENEDGTKTYPPVYFLQFADSALVVGVTVYYTSDNPTEIVKDDINTRVREALIRNGIEIPYPHVTVEHS